MQNSFVAPNPVFVERVREVRLLQILAGARHHQLSVLHPAQTENMIRKVPERAASALHDDHLETIVMIEMHMSGRKHFAAGVMLRVNQFLGQIRAMMIVNDSQCADDDFVLVGGLGLVMLAPRTLPAARPPMGSR